QAVARLCRGELDYRCAVSRNGKSNRRSTLQGHTGCGNGSSRALRVCPRHQQRRSPPCTCHEYDSGGGERYCEEEALGRNEACCVVRSVVGLVFYKNSVTLVHQPRLDLDVG